MKNKFMLHIILCCIALSNCSVKSMQNNKKEKEGFVQSLINNTSPSFRGTHEVAGQNHILIDDTISYKCTQDNFCIRETYCRGAMNAHMIKNKFTSDVSYCAWKCKTIRNEECAWGPQESRGWFNTLKWLFAEQEKEAKTLLEKNSNQK